MKWHFVALTLTFLVQGQKIVPGLSSTALSSSSQEQLTSGGPNIKCTVDISSASWRYKDHSPVISIKIESTEEHDLSVIPSVRLMALPKKQGVKEDEYWALFGITAEANTHEWQRLKLSAKKPTMVHVSPKNLLWGLTKSSASMWPVQKFTEAVPPGKYSLQVQLKINSDKTISSNEIEVSVDK
jgi:hypothetical protein